jgi:NADP-dependent 3-hydroxy acid dehydrogenase YdfG
MAGATGGIGRATVERLAAGGAEVVAVARREDPLAALARETGAVAHAGDMADPAAVFALRDAVLEEGVPWAVVHAAGAFDLAPVSETTPEMLDRMIDGNLRAPFLMARAFLPAMLERGAGQLVLVGSVAGRVAFPGNGAYSASKYGVRGLHEVLVQELRGTGVRCTLVEPAATDTSIWDPLDPDGREDVPGRAAMLAPGSVAEAILYALTRPVDVHVSTVAVQRS